MNQPLAGSSSVSGGAGPGTGRPGATGGHFPAGITVPAGSTERTAAGHDTDTDLLLHAAERDLSSLDHLGVPDQALVYDRLHTTLADALARTADAGVPTGPGDPGA